MHERRPPCHGGPAGGSYPEVCPGKYAVEAGNLGLHPAVLFPEVGDSLPVSDSGNPKTGGVSAPSQKKPDIIAFPSNLSLRQRAMGDCRGTAGNGCAYRCVKEKV